MNKSVKKICLKLTAVAILSLVFSVVSYTGVQAQLPGGVLAPQKQAVPEVQKAESQLPQAAVESAPKLERIWPSAGGRGQYLTLEGANFGSKAGEVFFQQRQTVLPADISFPQNCLNTWWRPGYVIVKVPSGAQAGEYTIRVKRADGVIAENKFIVTNAAASPGICGMVPDNGPAGVPVKMYGQNFGGQKGRITSGTTEFSLTGSEWSDDFVSAITPQADFEGGKVRLITANRSLSNPVPFTIGRCSQSSCGQGQSCCSDGSCRLTGMCEQKRILCRYSWNFYTGTLAGLGEACRDGTACVSGVCGPDKRCARGAKAENELCRFDAECTLGLKCDQGRCTAALKREGQKCSLSQECFSGTCTGGVCAPGDKKIGQNCSFHEQCANGNCHTGKCSQSMRCVELLSVEPKPTNIRQNSIFKATFNQLMDEQSVRAHMRLHPPVNGKLELTTLGFGNDAKTQAVFTPEKHLDLKTKYALIIDPEIKSASSDNTLGACKKSCSKTGEVCGMPGSSCTNGAICTGEGSVCSGERTQCTGAHSRCINGATCTGNNSYCINNPSKAVVQGPSSLARGELRRAGPRSLLRQYIGVSNIQLVATAYAQEAPSITYTAATTQFQGDTTPVLQKVELKSGTTNTAVLSWLGKTTNHEGYEIWRAKDSSVDAAFSRIADAGKTASTYDDTGLSAGTYYYKIAAYITDTSTGGTGPGSGTSNPVCGNGAVELGEECDGLSLNSTSCLNVYRGIGGYSGGTLKCTSLCKFDLGACTKPSSSAPAQCSPAYYDAKATTMTKENGAAITNGWSLWSNGSAIQKHIFAAAPVTITVRAAGDMDSGVLPHMKVSIGSVVIGEADVDGSLKDYSFQYTVPSSGEQEIKITFTNDSCSGCGTTPRPADSDRNLLINSIRVRCAPPAAPSNLVATKKSSSQINLSWRNNANNATTIAIERKKAGETSFTNLTTVGAAVTTFADTGGETGLSANTQYTYRVKALNAANEESDPSNEASATTDLFTLCLFTGTPSTPTGLVATAKSSSLIDLSWNDVSNNETGFEIQRSSDGENFAKVSAVAEDITTFSDADSKLTASTKYYYRVAAMNCKGLSNFSNIAQATTLASSSTDPVTLNPDGSCNAGHVKCWKDGVAACYPGTSCPAGTDSNPPAPTPTPCAIGSTLCGDGKCYSTACPNPPGPAACNANGICDTNESCSCSDCVGKQDSCASGAFCKQTVNRCVSTLCGNGTIDTDEECDEASNKCTVECKWKVVPPNSDGSCNAGHIKCLKNGVAGCYLGNSCPSGTDPVNQNPGGSSTDPVTPNPDGSCNAGHVKCWKDGVAACYPGTSCPAGTDSNPPVSEKPCKAGYTLCGDEKCHYGSLCPTPPGPAACNNNSVCDSNESCSCDDCWGKQDSCSSGLICKFSLRKCESPLCGNGKVDSGEECDETSPRCTAECTWKVVPPNSDGSCSAGHVKCWKNGVAGCYSGTSCPSGTDPNPPRGLCGNSIAENGELCDRGDLKGTSCQTLGVGYTGGTLSCKSDCTFNSDQCKATVIIAVQPVCGNGQPEAGEFCDKTDLRNQTCQSLGTGYTAGSLTCGSSCTYDTSKCVVPNPARGYCGNGRVDDGEQCDGTDFRNQSCTSLGIGYIRGTLGCDASCRYVVSACILPPTHLGIVTQHPPCANGYCLGTDNQCYQGTCPYPPGPANCSQTNCSSGLTCDPQDSICKDPQNIQTAPGPLGPGICAQKGATCDGTGDFCSNGGTCTGKGSTCSGKGTVCSGAGSKCVQGAKCTGDGSTCLNDGSLCSGTGSECRDNADCTGVSAKCTDVGSSCSGNYSSCTAGAQCTGLPPTTKAASCTSTGSVCPYAGSSCSAGARCTAIDSSCTGSGTQCLGNTNNCSAGSNCHGSKSKCTDMGTLCSGSESTCSNGAKCTGADSVCTGSGSLCTGANAQCASGAVCTQHTASNQSAVCTAEKSSIDINAFKPKVSFGPKAFIEDFFDALARVFNPDRVSRALLPSKLIVLAQNNITRILTNFSNQLSIPITGTTSPAAPLSSIQIKRVTTTSAVTTDVFTCAKKEGCTGDDDTTTLGNQHVYKVEALDAVGSAVSLPPDDSYEWTLSGGDSITLASKENTAIVTANPKDGITTVTVKTTKAPVKTATLQVTNDLCQGNRWPSNHSAAVISGYESAYDIELSYCKGENVDTVALLPGLTAVESNPGNTTDRDIAPFIKEYLFIVDSLVGSTTTTPGPLNGPCTAGYTQCSKDSKCYYVAPEKTAQDVCSALDKASAPQCSTTLCAQGLVCKVNVCTKNSDVIVMRVAENGNPPDFVSSAQWYSTRGLGAAPRSREIQGFGAVEDSNGIYISTVKVGGTAFNKGYILYLTKNIGANPQTLEIFNGLLASIKLAKSVPYSEAPTDIQTNDGQKLRRDIYRLAYMESLLRLFGASHPTLESGSYIVGKSTSAWPSWKSALANAAGRVLPQDPYPLSEGSSPFGSCPVETKGGKVYNYDPMTCWDSVNNAFYKATFDDALALDTVHVITYEYVGGTSKVCMNMEYLRGLPGQGVGQATYCHSK